jgi:hypothetical protein
VCVGQWWTGSCRCSPTSSSRSAAAGRLWFPPCGGDRPTGEPPDGPGGRGVGDGPVPLSRGRWACPHREGHRGLVQPGQRPQPGAGGRYRVRLPGGRLRPLEKQLDELGTVLHDHGYPVNAQTPAEAVRDVAADAAEAQGGIPASASDELTDSPAPAPATRLFRAAATPTTPFRWATGRRRRPEQGRVGRRSHSIPSPGVRSRSADSRGPGWRCRPGAARPGPARLPRG